MTISFGLNVFYYVDFFAGGQVKLLNTKQNENLIYS